MDNYSLRGGAISSLVYSRDLVSSWVEGLDLPEIDELTRKIISYTFERELSRRIPVQRYDLGVINIVAKDYLKRYKELGHRNFHRELYINSYLVTGMLVACSIALGGRAMTLAEERLNMYYVFEYLWKPRLMLEMTDRQVQLFFEDKDKERDCIYQIGTLCQTAKVYEACFPTDFVEPMHTACIQKNGRYRVWTLWTIDDLCGIASSEPGEFPPISRNPTLT
jgi:hypothetical protein